VLSKLFKPQPRTSWASERGRRLRELFEVEDDSPVLNRDVRNCFEHIDEHLDAWVLAQPQLTAEQVEAGDLDPLAAAPPPLLRVIRSEDGVIAVRNDHVNVPEVVAELRRVQAIAREIEPLARTYPVLAEALATLPFYPSELRLSAPTRRPDEPVTTGAAPIPDLPPLEEALRDAINEAAVHSSDQESTVRQDEAGGTSSDGVD
jgi:hypothetical protein